MTPEQGFEEWTHTPGRGKACGLEVCWNAAIAFAREHPEAIHGSGWHASLEVASAHRVKEAVLEEREACAKECEEISYKHQNSGRYVSIVADHSVRAGGQVDGADECAQAIRSRTKESK